MIGCNGHFLMKTGNRIHFANEYMDENKETVKPIKFNNKSIGYQYLENSKDGMNSLRYLVPCEYNGKIKYAKVLIPTDPSSTHIVLPTQDTFRIVNSSPSGEQVLNQVINEANKIANSIRCSHYKNIKEISSGKKEHAQPLNRDTYLSAINANFNICNNFNNRLFYVPQEVIGNVEFEYDGSRLKNVHKIAAHASDYARARDATNTFAPNSNHTSGLFQSDGKYATLSDNTKRMAENKLYDALNINNVSDNDSIGLKFQNAPIPIGTKTSVSLRRTAGKKGKKLGKSAKKESKKFGKAAKKEGGKLKKDVLDPAAKEAAKAGKEAAILSLVAGISAGTETLLNRTIDKLESLVDKDSSELPDFVIIKKNNEPYIVPRIGEEEEGLDVDDGDDITYDWNNDGKVDAIDYNNDNKLDQYIIYPDDDYLDGAGVETFPLDREDEQSNPLDGTPVDIDGDGIIDGFDDEDDEDDYIDNWVLDDGTGEYVIGDDGKIVLRPKIGDDMNSDDEEEPEFEVDEKNRIIMIKVKPDQRYRYVLNPEAYEGLILPYIRHELSHRPNTVGKNWYIKDSDVNQIISNDLGGVIKNCVYSLIENK